MLKIKKSTLEPTYHFIPEEASLTLEERTGSMTLTLGPEHPALEPNDWLMDDTEPGKGIVWRVKTIQENDDTATRTVTLEHIVNCLKDKIIYEEYDAGYVSAKTAINKALSYQSDFKLGTIEYSVSKPFTFNGDTVYDAIETVCTALDDPVWTYDLSTRPFIINIVKRSSTVRSEMRAGRNIKTLRKSVDRTGMYTRLYPRGENDLELSEKYVQLNTDLYGVISKMETDQSQTSEDMLRVWALDRLKRHCEPKVSITIDGLELADATGESLDRLRIGTICLVPLPEMSAEIREKITKLQWKKKITAPEEVTVTLANNQDDIASFIKNESSSATASATRSGRSSAKKAKEDHAWFVDTEDHVGMVAEAVAGPGANKDWSRVASIFADGTGLHGRVTEAEGDIVTHESRIDATERAIKAEVQDRTNADKVLEGRLDIESDKVGLVVGSKESRPVITVASFSGLASHVRDKSHIFYVSDEKKYYEWKNGTWVENVGPGNYINVGGIVSAINDDGTTTTQIHGDRIIIGELDDEDLDTWAADARNGRGVFAKYLTVKKLTAQEIETLLANIGDAQIGELNVGAITVEDDLGVDGNIMVRNNSGDWEYLNVADAQVSGSTLTITYVDGTTTTFSKATTLQVEYGGDNTGDTATYTVTAIPQGNTTTGAFKVKQSKAAAYVTDPNGTIRARIDNPQYGNGWTAAYNKVSLPTSSSTADNFEVKTPPSTVDGSAATETYTLGTSGMNNVCTVKNSAGTIVARLEHNKYNAGWTAAYNKVSLPTSSSTADNFEVKTPPSTVGGAAVTETYTLGTSGMNNVCTVKNSGGTIVARLEHNKYDAGWTAAYNRVTLPTAIGASDTRTHLVVKTPPSTVGGSAVSTSYTLRSTKNDAYISIYFGETLLGNYAHIVHNQYDSGKASVGVTLTQSGSVATATLTNNVVETLNLTGIHTTRYDMTCTNSTSVGGGVYQYTFTVYGTSGEHTVGAGKDFYR